MSTNSGDQGCLKLHTVYCLMYLLGDWKATLLKIRSIKNIQKYANHRQAQKSCSTPPCLWRFRDTDWTRWLQSSFLVSHKLGENVKSTEKDHNYYMVGEPEKGGHWYECLDDERFTELFISKDSFIFAISYPIELRFSYRTIDWLIVNIANCLLLSLPCIHRIAITIHVGLCWNIVWQASSCTHVHFEPFALGSLEPSLSCKEKGSNYSIFSWF